MIKTAPHYNTNYGAVTSSRPLTCPTACCTALIIINYSNKHHITSHPVHTNMRCQRRKCAEGALIHVPPDYFRRHNCAGLPGWAIEECHNMRRIEHHLDESGNPKAAEGPNEPRAGEDQADADEDGGADKASPVMLREASSRESRVRAAVQPAKPKRLSRGAGTSMHDIGMPARAKDGQIWTKAHGVLGPRGAPQQLRGAPQLLLRSSAPGLVGTSAVDGCVCAGAGNEDKGPRCTCPGDPVLSSAADMRDFSPDEVTSWGKSEPTDSAVLPAGAPTWGSARDYNGLRRRSYVRAAQGQLATRVSAGGA